MESSKQKLKARKYYASEDPESDPIFHNHHRSNPICVMTANKAILKSNLKSNDSIKRKKAS